MVAEAVAEMATQRQKILMAVDEAEESMHALSWCLQNVMSHCKGRRDTIILLYAIPYRSRYLITEEFGEGTAKQDKVVADSVIAMARNVCDNFPNVKVETEVQKGDPREVICETVERLKCDMVALECHGYGAIKRTFLRCVSDYCAHNANCSVLIVKKREQMISGEDLYVLVCECSCVRELGSLCVIRSCKGDMYGKLV